jgi:uncharacterized protein YjbI with pentapeptide repeats
MEGSADHITQTSKKDKSLTRKDVDELLNKAGSSKLNLSGHNLTGIDLSNFDLDRVDLSEADLTLANLSGADLTDANLTRAILIRANLNNTNLTRTVLDDADLREATFVGTKMSWTRLNKVNLSHTDLVGLKAFIVYLNAANLTGANLTAADLSHSDLIGAHLNGANLTKTNLMKSNLAEADMTEAILDETDLTEADLRKAILSQNALDNAILHNTKVRGASLSTNDPEKANRLDTSSRNAYPTTYTPPALLGAAGTPGLTKQQIIESIQVKQIAQANPANIQEVAATQLPIGNRYYESVLQQSQRSFQAALVLSIIGTLLIFAAIIFLFFRQPPNISYVSLAGGVVLDVIGGLNFYLYGRASALLVTFQPPLDRIGRFLLANSVCENLEGDIKNTTRAKLVEIIANVPTTTHNEVAETATPLQASKTLQRNRRSTTIKN